MRRLRVKILLASLLAVSAHFCAGSAAMAAPPVAAPASCHGQHCPAETPPVNDCAAHCLKDTVPPSALANADIVTVVPVAPVTSDGTAWAVPVSFQKYSDAAFFLRYKKDLAAVSRRE